jgi:hypothetical protein
MDEIPEKENCEPDDRKLHYGIQGLYPCENTTRKHVMAMKFRLREKTSFVAELPAAAGQ